MCVRVCVRAICKWVCPGPLSCSTGENKMIYIKIQKRGHCNHTTPVRFRSLWLEEGTRTESRYGKPRCVEVKIVVRQMTGPGHWVVAVGIRNWGGCAGVSDNILDSTSGPFGLVLLVVPLRLGSWWVLGKRDLSGIITDCRDRSA